MYNCWRQIFGAAFLFAFFTPLVGADTIIDPWSMGTRSRLFNSEGTLVDDSFRAYSGNSFGVYYGLDPRAPGGQISDAAATFRMSDLDLSTPLVLRMLVSEAWGWGGFADLNMVCYGSNGAVTQGDFLGGGSPIGIPSCTISQGDYKDAPLLFSVDVTSAAASARSLGFDFLGIVFRVSCNDHAADASVSRVWLTASRSAVPEPTSEALLAIAGGVIGLIGLKCRVAGSTSSIRRHIPSEDKASQVVA